MASTVNCIYPTNKKDLIVECNESVRKETAKSEQLFSSATIHEIFLKSIKDLTVSGFYEFINKESIKQRIPEVVQIDIDNIGDWKKNVGYALTGKIINEYARSNNVSQLFEDLDRAIDFGFINKDKKNKVLKDSSPFNAQQQGEIQAALTLQCKSKNEIDALNNIEEQLPTAYYQLVYEKNGEFFPKDRHERVAVLDAHLDIANIDPLIEFEVEKLLQLAHSTTQTLSSFFDEVNLYSNHLEKTLGKDRAQIVLNKILSKANVKGLQSALEVLMLKAEKSDKKGYVKQLIIAKNSGFISEETYLVRRHAAGYDPILGQTPCQIVKKFQSAKCDVGFAQDIKNICEKILSDRISQTSEYSDFDMLMLNVDNSNEEIRTRYQILLKSCIEKLISKIADSIERCDDPGIKERSKNTLKMALQKPERFLIEKAALNQLEIDLNDAIDQGICTRDEAENIWGKLVSSNISDRNRIVNLLTTSEEKTKTTAFLGHIFGKKEKKDPAEESLKETKDILTNRWVDINKRESFLGSVKNWSKKQDTYDYYAPPKIERYNPADLL